MIDPEKISRQFLSRLNITGMALAEKKSQNSIGNFEMLYKNGKPKGVIISMKQFEEYLEFLEDKEDIQVIKEIKKKPLKLHKWKDVKKELSVV